MNKKIIELINKHFVNVVGPIGNGISNYTFLCDDKYYVKTSFDKRFPLFEDEEAFNLLYSKHISPKHFVLEKNIVASEKLLDYKSFKPSEYTEKHIISLIKTIKKLHKIKLDNIKSLTLKDIYQNFYNVLQNKDNIKDISSEYDKVKLDSPCLCHLDLLTSNIFFNEDYDCKIIDFDFCCVTNPELDILSLITENDFNEKQKKLIISYYFDNDEKQKFIEDLPKLSFLFDYLWYIWAIARIENIPDELKKVYKEIAQNKYSSAKNSKYNLDKNII